MEDKKVLVRATKDQILEFKKSFIWKDIKRELGAWKKGFEIETRTMVEDIAETNPSSASVLTHLGDLNGRIKTVDYLLSLPDIFLQILEEQKNDNRRDET